MTDLEKRAVIALRKVRLPAVYWQRARFEALNTRAVLQPGSRLGFTEEAELWGLVWRYRRQIKDAAVVAHADELMNGVKHLAF